MSDETRIQAANDALNSALDRAASLHADLAAARALISWVNGMCVDEEPWLEIRAGIDEYYEAQRDGVGGAG